MPLFEDLGGAPAFLGLWGSDPTTCTGPLLDWDVSDRLHEIVVPTLIVCGWYDEIPPDLHFKLAESRGIRILPGSDPLPIASESHRPGSFGFAVQASMPTQEPAKKIKKILLDNSFKLQSYGTLESPYRFFRNQLAMQVKKQLRKESRLN